MEPIGYTPVKPTTLNLEPDWSMPEGADALGFEHSYHPEGGLFVPDYAPVDDTFRKGTESETPVHGLGADGLIYAAFVAGGVSTDRASLLARALIGADGSQMERTLKVMNSLKRTFGTRPLPHEVSEFPESVTMSLDEAMRGLLQISPSPAVYVLPSDLLNVAKSIDQIEFSYSKDCVRMFYRGSKAFGMDVPPMPSWTNATIDQIVSFLNRMGGRFVSFPIGLERVALSVHNLCRYSFSTGEFKMDTHEGVLRDAVTHRRPYLYDRRDGREVLRNEVLYLLQKFQLAIGARVTAGISSTKPQLVACTLLRESPLLQTVMSAFDQYLRILPTPFVTELAHKSMPPIDFQEILRNTAVNVYQAQTPGNPRADPLPGSLYGSEMGSIMEIFSAMQLARIIDAESARKAIVVTTPKLVDDFNYLGYGVANIDKIAPRLSHLGNEYSSVVITRGAIGGTNDLPVSFTHTDGPCVAMLKMVTDLCNCAPDMVAICGPFDYWKEIPEWVSVLARHYELRTSRPHMGSQPMFWAHGSRGSTNEKRLKELMRKAYRDLQLSGMLGNSMKLVGQSSFPLKHRIFDSADFKRHVLQVEGDLFLSTHPGAQEVSVFLVMKTLGLIALSSAQSWSGLK